MLRELSELLIELHEGLVAIESRQLGPSQFGPSQGVALAEVEMRLPVELRAVFRDGGCRLLGEFARSSGSDTWTPLVSQLHLHWSRAGSSADTPAEDAP